MAEDETIRVGELAGELGGSEMTIRRDIRRFERDGFIRQTYGGATAHVTRSFDISFNARALLAGRGKRLIGMRAAGLVQDARVLFVGIGSTTEQFVQYLSARADRTVVTPSLPIASLLGTRPVRVVTLGGAVLATSSPASDRSPSTSLGRYRFDAAVVGAAGISSRWGITELTQEEAAVQRAALERTERVIVLADGSKVGAATPIVVGPPPERPPWSPIPRPPPRELDRAAHQRRQGGDRRARRTSEDAAHGRVAAVAGRTRRLTMNALGRIFGGPKPVIAMLHLPGLPGRPLHDRSGGTAAAVETVARDLDALQAAGVDGVLFCNEEDLPYQLRVGPEITAAMASVIGQVRRELRVPFGVNILWDPMASLAVARATGASFIREMLTGVYESDLGMIEPNIGEIAAYRRAIGGDDVAMFANPGRSSRRDRSGASRSGQSAAYMGLDALLISGAAGGVPFAMSDLRQAKDRGAGLAGHRKHGGARRADRRDLSENADGAIVGTSLKVDGTPGSRSIRSGASDDGGRARCARSGIGAHAAVASGDPAPFRHRRPRVREVLPEVPQRGADLQAPT